MKELAKSLCDFLLQTYGDLALVTPAAFAAALRAVGHIPEDASPTHVRYWITNLVAVRWEAAPTSLPGLNYEEEGSSVIETGRARGSIEANLTLPHEFGECLERVIDDELAVRGMPALGWRERDWEKMSIELVAPVATFKAAARTAGLDLTAFPQLSYESVVYRMKEAFDDEAPLFAVYYGNRSKWVRGKGFQGEDWQVRACSWTRQWLRYGYVDGRELLRLPRRNEECALLSVIGEARSRRNAILVHTLDRAGARIVETAVLFRRRCYGRDPAQIFVVGVEASHAHMLQPQLALVDAEERQATFSQLFAEG